MLATIDRRTATRIIHSLSESGQPPKLGAHHINVGTEPILKRLRSDYLEDLLLAFEGQDGAGACKWIEANYGNGKTQFLRCVQEQAWELDFVTAFVELAQDSCPLDRPELVFGAVAKSVQARPLSPADVDRGRGLDITLQQLLDRRFPGVLSGMPDDDLREQAVTWVKSSLANTQVESSAFREAAVQHLAAKLAGDIERSHVTSLYLRGEPIPAAEIKAVGVYEKLDKSSGFRLLRSMCQLIQRSGLASGTVMLFDEARRSLSLMSSKQEKVACENLLSVINRCNSGELPGTLFLYAVMPEFFTDFVTTYPALQQRCGPSTRINLEVLQGIKEPDLLAMIGDRITELFLAAYDGLSASADVLQANKELLIERALKRTMVGAGTRRIFVRAWVHVLQHLRTAATSVFEAAQIDNIMDEVLQQQEAEDQASCQGE